MLLISIDERLLVGKKPPEEIIVKAKLSELKDLILGQMQFKKESHYLELGETGSTKNLSKTGG